MPTRTRPVTICPRCGPTRRRCDTSTALVLIGLLVGVLAGVSQAFFARGTGPQPAGLYVAAIAAAVAQLWLVARAFAGSHCPDRVRSDPTGGYACRA
jgi:hypothetical protein